MSRPERARCVRTGLARCAHTSAQGARNARRRAKRAGCTRAGARVQASARAGACEHAHACERARAGWPVPAFSFSVSDGAASPAAGGDGASPSTPAA